MGVASYKLVSNTVTDHTDDVDYHEMQDLNLTVLENDAPSPLPPPTPPPLPPLKTFHEEHTYTTPSGQVINYSKSTAKGMNGHHNSDSLLSKVEEDFLRMVKTVSEEMESTIQQHQQRQQNAACTSALTAVEEFTMMPAPIAVCEFN